MNYAKMWLRINQKRDPGRIQSLFLGFRTMLCDGDSLSATDAILPVISSE